MTDWATTASLATAGGTLILAIATFGSTHSANRAARTAERAMLAGLRPLLLTSRLQDPEPRPRRPPLIVLCTETAGGNVIPSTQNGQSTERRQVDQWAM